FKCETIADHKQREPHFDFIAVSVKIDCQRMDIYHCRERLFSGVMSIFESPIDPPSFLSLSVEGWEAVHYKWLSILVHTKRSLAQFSGRKPSENNWEKLGE
ncbi:MAG TPA: hypothetical protein PKN02_10975, partial [Thermotogota bacterium]|nr:hypothetical protein [Thermotogota bacterium]